MLNYENGSSEMSEDSIHLELFTKHDHREFFNGDAFVNDSGNVCIYLDEKNFAVLTPKMAKRLSQRLDEASRQALAEHLAE